MVTKTQYRKLKLTIDTTGETGKVCLGDQCLSWPARGKVELLLAKIDRLFKVEGLTFKDLKAIEVNPGPGSFMGSRVGVTVANMLAWVLGLVVNGKRPPIAVQYPLYGPTGRSAQSRAAR